MVNRELCQVVTKGTRFDPGTIHEATASFLMAIVEVQNEGVTEIGAAFVDTSTGRFFLGSFHEHEMCKPGLTTLLEEIIPAEVLYVRGGLSQDSLQVRSSACCCSLRESCRC